MTKPVKRIRKLCEQCGDPFRGTPQAVYCGPKCRKEARREQKRVAQDDTEQLEEDYDETGGLGFYEEPPPPPERIGRIEGGWERFGG